MTNLIFWPAPAPVLCDDTLEDSLHKKDHFYRAVSTSSVLTAPTAQLSVWVGHTEVVGDLNPAVLHLKQ